MTWQPTGSSVSGDNYGYEVYHDGQHARYAVVLKLGWFYQPTAATLVPADTYEDAVGIGQRFMHACNCWRIVRERARLLASGICLVGG